MTEEEQQQAAAYLKLQDDAKKLIKEVVIDLLMNQEDPASDIVHSVLIDIICSAVEDKPIQFRQQGNAYQRPQFKLQEAILKLAFPHRS
jgi:hypothetical protein